MNRQPPRKLSPYELIEIYQPTQKLLKGLLNDEYDKLDKIKELENSIINSADKRKESYQEKENLKWLLVSVYVNFPREEVMKKIEHYKKLISIIKYLNTKKKKGDKSQNVRLNIEHAKSIPITDYLEFNRAHRGTCLWHEPDRNPSMYYDRNRNRVYCFSCNEGGDVIDVVQKLFNKEFIDAVKIILKK